MNIYFSLFVFFFLSILYIILTIDYIFYNYEKKDEDDHTSVRR